MLCNLLDMASGWFASIVIVIIISLTCVLLYGLFLPNKCAAYMTEHMITVGKVNSPEWNRNTCKYIVNSTLEKVLKDYNIPEHKGDIRNDPGSELWMPCTYEDIDDEINQITPKHDNQRFFIISGTDLITAKEQLWKHIVAHHGIDRARAMMPMTYVLGDEQDAVKLKKDYELNENKLYIMKKNIQRQEGLQITNSLPVLLNGNKLGYVVAQELLQDPYIIGKRKTNMRFYILVVCQNGNLDVYAYNNGFMYYTKDEFVRNSTATGPNITTGYIDRWVYDVNPLTHGDLRKYLDDPNRKLNVEEAKLRAQGFVLSEIVFDRIYDLLRNVFISYVGKICTNAKMRKYVSFQIFGADIAVNDHLVPKIMEVNKGPDLGAKDKRDGDVKYGCTKDALRIVGLITDQTANNENGFIRLFDFHDGKINV